MLCCARWSLALLGTLVFLSPATPAATRDRDLSADTTELASYLHDFDHHAHASADELKSELASPALMVRGGYGGPAAIRSLTREALDENLKAPLPADFALQRVQILSEGPVAAANLIYKATDEGREIDMGVLLPRDGKSWKVAAMAIAPPSPDSSLVGKFLKDAEQSFHGNETAILSLFAAPVHRIASRGAADAVRSDTEAMTQDQAGALLGLPLPGRARLQKTSVLANYIDGAIAELQFKNAGPLTRALVLIARPQEGWKIVAVARE